MEYEELKRLMREQKVEMTAEERMKAYNAGEEVDHIPYTSKGFFRLLRRRSPVFFYRPMLRTSYTTLQMPSDRLRVVGGWGMAGLS